MKKTVSAAVCALLTAMLLLSSCGGNSSDIPFGTIDYDSSAPVSDGPETIPAGTDTEGPETDIPPDETDDGTDDLDVDEDYVSSGTFTFKKTEDGETWLRTYEGSDPIVVIPAEDPEKGTPVTGIDVWAFRDNETVRKIVIPDTVTTIEKNAFMYCSALEQVVLPESLTKIGSQAFYRCSALKKVSVPEGVEKLEYATFMFCESLEEITLPGTLTEIGDLVFSHCDTLLTINFRGSEGKWWEIVFSDNAMPPTWYTTIYDYAG